MKWPEKILQNACLCKLRKVIWAWRCDDITQEQRQEIFERGWKLPWLKKCHAI